MPTSQAPSHARKIIASEWLSLDGVCDANSMDKWWVPYHSDARGKAIQEGLAHAGAILLGRVTYEMLASYWPNMQHNEDGIADSLNSLPKVVVSTTLQQADWNNSIIVRDNVIAELTRLKRQSGSYILIIGSGTLVRSLAKAGLIDEYRLLLQPIIMGSGKRYFTEGMDMTKLKLTRSQALELDVMQLWYEPAAV